MSIIYETDYTEPFMLKFENHDILENVEPDPILRYKISEDYTKEIIESTLLPNEPDYKQQDSYSQNLFPSYNDIPVSMNEEGLQYEETYKLCDNKWNMLGAKDTAACSNMNNENLSMTTKKKKGSSEENDVPFVEKEQNYLRILDMITKTCLNDQCNKEKSSSLNKYIQSTDIMFTKKNFKDVKKLLGVKKFQETQKYKSYKKKKEKKESSRKKSSKDDILEQTINSKVVMQSKAIKKSEFDSSDGKKMKNYYTFNEFNKKGKKNKERELPKITLTVQNFESVENLRKNSEHIPLYYL